jgi:GATA-binding protein 1
MCSNCKSTETPSWRRDPRTRKLVCNACGLYKKLHGKDRVVTVSKDGIKTVKRDSIREYVCENCGTFETPLWRKGVLGMIFNRANGRNAM